MKVSPTTKGPRRTTPAPSLSRRPASPWNSDRKSTRLNSSHSQNADAVFCLNKMSVDFVANASHELRTPLSTLIGYAETLREQADEIDPLTPDRFLSVVHDEPWRMQRGVADL